VASTGNVLTLPTCSASQAVLSAVAVGSTVVVSQPASDSSVGNSSTFLAAATSSQSSSVSVSSTLSTSSMPAPSTLPLSLNSFMAALSNVGSIARIADQLFPGLARMDVQMLMQLLQMVQVANPTLAATPSTSYLQSAVTADVQQLSTAFAQMLTAPSAANRSGVVQNDESVCVSVCVSSSSSCVEVSSSSSSVEVTQVSDTPRCSSTASCDSFESSIYSSESSQFDVNTLVQVERNIFDAIDTCRPSSTALTTATERQLDASVASTFGPILFSCHLCAFRSSHRMRFAEHLSSEFCNTDSLMMTVRPSDREPTRRKRCNHCAFSTYITEEFDHHVRIHMSSCRCTYCDYTGSSNEALRLHFKRHHPTKSFSSSERERRHMSRAECSSDDRSDSPQPQFVNLDPVVKLFRVDRSDSSKLRSRYSISF